MAAKLITSYDNFIPSSISYGAPRTNARGGKSIKIQDEKRNNLVLTTPLLLTWGINKMTDEKTNNDSYNIALQFPGEGYSNDSTDLFFDKIKEFESLVLDSCVENSKEWFGKPNMSRELAKELMYPILKYPKDKETQELDYSRPPTMKIKIPYWEGKFNLELYDTEREQLFNPTMSSNLSDGDFEQYIPKTSHIVGVIQCNGVWFTSGRFGVTWQLTQAIVRRPVRIEGKCFLSLGSDDQQTLDDVSKRESNKSASDDVPDVDTTQVEDSDNEQDEPELQEKPKKTTTKVRRKVTKKTT